MAIAKNVLVLIADGRPDSDRELFQRDGIDTPVGPIPVQFEFGNTVNDTLGLATLHWEGDRLRADINFQGPNTQVDRLAGLTPAIAYIVVQKCQVTRIVLSATKNVDERIPTLGEQHVFDKSHQME